MNSAYGLNQEHNSKTASRRASSVFLLLAFTVLISFAYFPVLANPFLFHDDYVAVFWDRTSVFTHHYTWANFQQGRWITAYLNALEDYWLNFDTSRYVRFAGIVQLSLVTFLNFHLLQRLAYPRLASFILVLVLTTLPPFQASIFGITSGQYILDAILAAQASFLCAHRASTQSSNPWWLRGTALVLLVAAQCTYPAGACYYLVFLVFYFLAPSVPVSWLTLRRTCLMLIIFLLSMVVFYIGTIAGLHWMHLAENSAEGRGLSLNHNVLGQIGFYLSQVVPKTANLWHIEALGSPGGKGLQSVSSLILVTTVICAAAVGIRSLLGQKAQDGLLPVTVGFTWAFAAVTLLLIPLTVAPMLAAVPGRIIFYRTLHAHMTILVFLAFWGAVHILSLSCRGRTSGEQRAVNAVVSLVVLISTTVYCNYMLERYIVVPAMFERSYVSSSLKSVKSTDSFIDIAIRQDDSRGGFTGRWVEDAWGISATRFSYSVPFLMSILQEKGIDLAHFARDVDDKHLAWPHGRITVLTSDADHPPTGALLIDMRLLFPLAR